MDDTNVLYVNSGNGFFDDRTTAAGLGVETRFVNWGAAIADLDNDGNPDLFYLTSKMYLEVERKNPQHPLKSPRVIFRSRGCALGDFDNDDDVDILIVNLNEPPSLLRNDLGGDNRRLNVKLIGTKSESERDRFPRHLLL